MKHFAFLAAIIGVAIAMQGCAIRATPLGVSVGVPVPAIHFGFRPFYYGPAYGPRFYRPGFYGPRPYGRRPYWR